MAAPTKNIPRSWSFILQAAVELGSGWRAVVLAALVPACLLMSASGAQALPDGVITVRPASDASPELLQQALAVIYAHFASAKQQVTPPDNVDCDLDCAVVSLAEHHASMALQLELWVPRGFRAEGSVAVTVKDTRGSSVGRAAFQEMAPEKVREAVQTALEGALAGWPSRGGILVRVDGTPAGASVVVDHDPELGGQLPLELRLSPGAHAISVSQYGYADDEQSISVPQHLDDPLEVRVDLRPLSAGQAEPERTQRNRKAHLIGASALAAAGAAALIVGSIGLARDSDCAEQSASGVCVREQPSARASSATYAAVGGLALLGGATWATWVAIKWQPGAVHASVKISIPAL
jgi:hypothetical protein